MRIAVPSWFFSGPAAVTGRNSIFWDFLGGTKLNVGSLSLGAASHFGITTTNWGAWDIRFEVTMNFRGNGLLPCWVPDLPVDLRVAEGEVIAGDAADGGGTDDECRGQAFRQPIEGVLVDQVGGGAVTSSFSRAKSSMASSVEGAATIA